LLPWVHVRFIPLAITVMAVATFEWLRRGGLWYLYAVLPFGISLQLMLAFYLVLYGYVPAAQEWGEFSLRYLPAGLLGLLLDADRGLLVNAPVWGLALLGAVDSLRSFARRYWLPAVVTLPYLLVIASFNDWNGGWSPPSRMLVVLVPLFAVWLAHFLKQFDDVPVHLAVVPLWIMSLFTAVWFMLYPSLRFGAARREVLEGLPARFLLADFQAPSWESYLTTLLYLAGLAGLWLLLRHGTERVRRPW